MRAHRALEVRLGRVLPCHLEVRKRIPVGGGLGGGSSDAAAALLALRQAFGLELSDAELAAVGATIGSDVAFFIDEAHRPGVVTGFGGEVERTPRVSGTLTLVIPLRTVAIDPKLGRFRDTGKPAIVMSCQPACIEPVPGRLEEANAPRARNWAGTVMMGSSRLWAADSPRGRRSIKSCRRMFRRKWTRRKTAVSLSFCATLRRTQIAVAVRNILRLLLSLIAQASFGQAKHEAENERCPDQV